MCAVVVFGQRHTNIRALVRHTHPLTAAQYDGFHDLRKVKEKKYHHNRHEYLGDLYDVYGNMLPGNGFIQASKYYKLRHNPGPQQRYELLSSLYPMHGFGFLAKSHELRGLQHDHSSDPLEVEKVRFERNSILANLLGHTSLASFFRWKSILADEELGHNDYYDDSYDNYHNHDG